MANIDDMVKEAINHQRKNPRKTRMPVDLSRDNVLKMLRLAINDRDLDTAAKWATIAEALR